MVYGSRTFGVLIFKSGRQIMNDNEYQEPEDGPDFEAGYATDRICPVCGETCWPDGTCDACD